MLHPRTQPVPDAPPFGRYCLIHGRLLEPGNTSVEVPRSQVFGTACCQMCMYAHMCYTYMFVYMYTHMFHLSSNLAPYIYICAHAHRPCICHMYIIHIYIHICIKTERERERYICIYVYETIYIYIYMHR